ncbi:hypothetical protein [Salinispora cortesiana]|uniref:hypothetical protein n=1 Tax=Salinispora cortesiana TaxID=1305843 RepID=UPI00041603E7|nr:hypothetical protein [Salinispora cortesiana]
MRGDWDPEDLIACWTLLDSDWQLVANKTGATRLGFVALLKFFEIEGREGIRTDEGNPCRVVGADQEKAAERPALTVPQIFALAEQMPERFRALILVTTFRCLRGARWSPCNAATSTCRPARCRCDRRSSSTGEPV